MGRGGTLLEPRRRQAAAARLQQLPPASLVCPPSLRTRGMRTKSISQGDDEWGAERGAAGKTSNNFSLQVQEDSSDESCSHLTKLGDKQ